VDQLFNAMQIQKKTISDTVQPKSKYSIGLADYTCINSRTLILGYSNRDCSYNSQSNHCNDALSKQFASEQAQYVCNINTNDNNNNNNNLIYTAPYEELQRRWWRVY